jgi:hypothetical protein
VNYPISALRRAASVVFGLVVALAVLASCSGNVGEAPSTGPAPSIVVSPSEATLFSELPTTFIVTGGNGTYIIASSNQAAVPISGTFIGSSFTVIPNPVAADTPVTLTVRDTGTATPVTVALNVRPRTITNTVTITPAAGQPTECGTAVCSGSDAEVRTTLVQTGLPVAGREIRFEVISGDFRIITSPAGLPETTALTGTALTDASGTARIRIRALTDAPSQNALLQITDVGSGAFQRTAFMIVQATGASAGFFVSPNTVTFTGANTDLCGSGEADVFIFGGAPGYTISNPNPGTIGVSREFVAASGGSFRVSTFGTCTDFPITVRDAQGRSTTVRVQSIRGTTSAPSLAVAPTQVTLSDCTSAASVTVVGGSGNYTATSGSGSVIVSRADNNTFSIRRNSTSPAVTGSVPVGISDGRATVTVTVNLEGEGAGACPATSTGFSAEPRNVQLTTCDDVAEVSLAGGSGQYTASSQSPALTATRVGSRVQIRRNKPSGSFTSGTVVVSDGSTSFTITVTGVGSGAGACSGGGLSTNPTEVTLQDCRSSPSVVISGAIAAITASPSNTGIIATLSGNVLTISRRPSSDPIPSSADIPCANNAGNQCVTISDGSSTAQIPVILQIPARAACPA